MSFTINHRYPTVFLGTQTPQSGSVADPIHVTGSIFVTNTPSATVNFPPVQVVTGSMTVNLPAGAARESTLSEINSKVPYRGQATKAESFPVVFASDQDAFPVTISSLANITGSVHITNPSMSVIVSGTPMVTGSVNVTNQGQATMAKSMPVVLASNQSAIPVTMTQGALPPTFMLTASSVQVAFNKSMLSILNAAASTVLLRLHSFYLVNVQNDNVTGVVGNFELRRCAGHSGGLQLVPYAFDTGDALSASITCRSGATIATEDTAIFWRAEWSTDQWTSGAGTLEQFDHTVQATTPQWQTPPGTKPFTLRAGQGLTVKFTTNSNIGVFDIKAIFTQETP